MSGVQRRKYFAAELKKALDRNNLTISQLAREVGIKYDRVHHWVSGRSMPSIHVVQQICDALGDEEIMIAAVRVNTRICSNCSKEYVQESSQGRSFLCGADCRQQSNRLKEKTGKSSIQLTQYVAQDEYKLAVDEYCKGCEPAGICVTPQCALRPISPLPLFSKTEAVNGSGANWSAERIKIQQEHITKLQPTLIARRAEIRSQKDAVNSK